MLEIFSPVPISEFCHTHSEKLADHARPYCIEIQARWINRKLCISGVDHLPMPLLGKSLSEPEKLKLSLSVPGHRFEYAVLIREWGESIVRQVHAAHDIYERVHDGQRRVHLLKPFRSTSVCGKWKTTWGPIATSALTCKACIKLAYYESVRTPDALEKVALSLDELNKVTTSESRAKIVWVNKWVDENMARKWK